MTQPDHDTEIHTMLAEIERKRAAMSPEARAMLEREERAAQRESWVRGMSTPCEHGMLDFEQCGDCVEAAFKETNDGE